MVLCFLISYLKGFVLPMLELIRYHLEKKEEWDDFYGLFRSYLSEVCDEEEYKEEIDDLHNDELNARMINQTLRDHDPYFIMRIVENQVCVGLISYSYHEEHSRGFINNFYVCSEHRNSGIGSAALKMVENHLRSFGAKYIELAPVARAERFYIRNGFELSRISSDGERFFGKVLR
ncbi:MAG: GNAT family N-acetyltransferase [Oscillospiraceae bacterium]|nr:GNAT family N-acetyltransferase [Oscillospiraceae bacterium]